MGLGSVFWVAHTHHVRGCLLARSMLCDDDGFNGFLIMSE